MRHDEFRFILFHPDEGGVAAICIDAGAAGEGESYFEAVQSLIENLDACFELTAGTRTKIACKPAPEDLAIFDALTRGKSVPKALLDASGYEGTPAGFGTLVRETVRRGRGAVARKHRPIRRIDLRGYSLIGA